MASTSVAQTSSQQISCQHSSQGSSMQQTSTQTNFSQGSSSIQQTSTQTNSRQTNETVISLDAAQLGQPYVLRVSAPKGTQLTGQISLGNKVIKRFASDQAVLNLSPNLLRGRPTLKISGTYKPAQSAVKVEFSGPGTDLSQEIGGSGKLDQTLVINVQWSLSRFSWN